MANFSDVFPQFKNPSPQGAMTGSAMNPLGNGQMSGYGFNFDQNNPLSALGQAAMNDALGNGQMSGYGFNFDQNNPLSALGQLANGNFPTAAKLPSNVWQQLSDFGLNIDPNNPLAVLSQFAHNGMFRPQNQPSDQNGSGAGSNVFGQFAQQMPQQYIDSLNSPGYQNWQSQAQGPGQGGFNFLSLGNSNLMRNLLTNPSAYGQS